MIEELRKEDNDSEIESEKLLESSTEKDLKEKEVDEKADNVDDSDSTPVVVRRRQKKTSPSTPPLPPGQFFLIWALPGLFFKIYFSFSWYIVSSQLIIFTMVNDDRKHERRRKSMYRSITRN